MIGYKLTRHDCPGWIFCGTTPKEVASVLQNEIESDDGNDLPAAERSAVIEGLQLLQKYYKFSGGYNIGAEHDVLYATATDKPVVEPDLSRLIELGWFQEDVDYGEEFKAELYSAEDDWTAYV